MRQIAQEAGVSVGTVSQVLSGRSKAVRPGAAARADLIRQIADHLGYRRNTAARAVSTGRFNTVAVVESAVGGRSSFFGGALFDGIHEVLAAAGLHTIVAKLPDSSLTSDEYMPSILRELSADGLLLNYFCEVPQRLRELVNRYRIPAVWINVKQDYDSVYLDDVQVGYDATRCLIDSGLRQVAYADYENRRPPGANDPPVHYSYLERLRGYERAMRQAGLRAWSLHDGAASLPRREVLLAFREFFATAKENNTLPEGLVCYSHASALPALHAAAEAGIRIPQDMALIMIEDQMPPSGVLATAWRQDWRAVGRAGATMLLEKLEAGRPLPSRCLKFVFEPGETAPVPTPRPGQPNDLPVATRAKLEAALS